MIDHKDSCSPNWQYEGTISNDGDSIVVEGGRFLRVDRMSSTPGLDGRQATANFYPLDVQGRIIPLMRATLGPDFSVGGHVLPYITSTAIVDSRFSSNRWTVRVPRQQAPHDNSSGVWMNIYTWKIK